MREIIKKILEVVGNEDAILIGNEGQGEIKSIRPEEIELYPRRYKNIIVNDLDLLDEKDAKKLANMADRLWVLFSIDNLIKKLDSTVEDMISKKEFRNIDVNEKIENLKRLLGSDASIVNFNLPDMAVVIPKVEEKFLRDVKTESFSSFFLNLSMVEYLKSRLVEVKKEKERLEFELGGLRILNRDRERIIEKKDREIKEERRRFRRQLVRLSKELKRREEEIKRKEEEIKRRDKTMEEEIKRIVFEMGLKLEDKEEFKKMKDIRGVH